MRRAKVIIGQLPITDDPAYHIPARLVAAAFQISRAALYKRQDLLRLARRKNNRAKWRKADLARAGADVSVLAPRLVRDNVMEQILSVPAGWLVEHQAPCREIPYGEGVTRRYEVDEVMDWIAKGGAACRN